MTASLLPPNATPLALALESVLAADDRLAGIEAITGAKLDAPDTFLPWLLWEYGLGELQAYLPDPRQAIRDGIAWQRMRGTPAGLVTALGWIGFAAAAIEESGAGFGWARYQLDVGAVPSAAATADIAAVARLAAPARARLVRLYHGYDLRAARYDTPMDRRCLYDDWSGINVGGVRQSFRTVETFAGPPADSAGDGGSVTSWGLWGRSDALLRYDGAGWDHRIAQVAVPASVAVQAHHGVADPLPVHVPAAWSLARAVLADGVAYDSLSAVLDGYAVQVPAGPEPRYDATRYDAGRLWRWLAAGDRTIEVSGAAFAAPADPPAVASSHSEVTGYHGRSAAWLQQYDSYSDGAVDVAGGTDSWGLTDAPAVGWGAGPWLDQAWDASSAGAGTGAASPGFDPLDPAAPWGAGPWLDQPWELSSTGMAMEVRP